MLRVNLYIQFGSLSGILFFGVLGKKKIPEEIRKPTENY
ncbi:hypothetical protein LEP1GSC016_2642 [Leptospira borgpetersenii serovar Hardjo-bovis str. Sponselee]|uniref:Uncharacterized protein n=4 Tax=Leptospira borgpetersenii TaxID=174 RepID=M6C319_LEPBO|nr:hypothetical protein LEP1GSC128_3486 [Leptospira borgpetersenii str. 200801926]EKQ98877.1 hypothetical protein LEP1GSC121_0441 [Leptospira borgpetersenii serovar Castellonis str. 200801910]EMJ83173.1 hypothetical protein LEP1GSC016_2642 [Leptospira borgpetersenii serovar Hardjo-bovis str. Sponselee]EMK09323.1 hypothetical protein LEP1GSC066_1589 [Leptospira sp. serovar Kenya str. Sh9]EMN13749.1 hypothetical protein LEP1GSC055_3840 [Leptospira borgpetersenii str. Brem 307]EMN17891.1 hypothet